MDVHEEKGASGSDGVVEVSVAAWEHTASPLWRPMESVELHKIQKCLVVPEVGRDDPRSIGSHAHGGSPARGRNA